jgi:hypothetical protein
MKMKKTILVIGLIVIMLGTGILGGCYRLSEDNGNLTTTTFDFTDFTAIEIENHFELEITYAETYSITISGAEKVLDRLEVNKSGDTLKVGLNDRVLFWFWNSSPKAVITLPDLRRLDVSGASHGFVSGFKSAHDFAMELSGASNLDIDMETADFRAKISGASDADFTLIAGNFAAEASGASTLNGNVDAAGTDIELSGASHARLTGSGGDLKLYASGASNAKLSGYPVNNADVNLSGASHADIEVSGKLDLTLSGASNLDYYGEPSLGKTEISGASDLNHKTQ